MIGYLSGKILSFDEQSVILDVNGVGYDVFVGKTFAGGVGEIGEVAAFWVYTYVREDQLTLFGFPDPMRKKIFLILIGVNGVGPKLALAVIAQLEPDTLVEAITAGDIRILTSISGIGKKMAERMVLELREKLSGLVAIDGLMDKVHTGASGVWKDLNDALLGLGFPDSKVRNVIRLLRQEKKDSKVVLDDVLKLALQKINQ